MRKHPCLGLQTTVCMCEYGLMAEAISITLSPSQVDAVVRAAARNRPPGVCTLISRSLAGPDAPGSGGRHRQPPPADGPEPGPGATVNLSLEHVDPRLSRSLLRGFALLACLHAGGGGRGIVELADELGLSASTAHRYALTLVELGLLEQCPRSRKYRLAHGP